MVVHPIGIRWPYGGDRRVIGDAGGVLIVAVRIDLPARAVTRPGGPPPSPTPTDLRFHRDRRRDPRCGQVDGGGKWGNVVIAGARRGRGWRGGCVPRHLHP